MHMQSNINVSILKLPRASWPVHEARKKLQTSTVVLNICAATPFFVDSSQAE